MLGGRERERERERESNHWWKCIWTLTQCSKPTRPKVNCLVYLIYSCKLRLIQYSQVFLLISVVNSSLHCPASRMVRSDKKAGKCGPPAELQHGGGAVALSQHPDPVALGQLIWSGGWRPVHRLTFGFRFSDLSAVFHNLYKESRPISMTGKGFWAYRIVKVYTVP